MQNFVAMFEDGVPVSRLAEEDLDDTIHQLPGGICSEDDQTTDSISRNFFDSSTIVEGATLTYKMTTIGMQTMVDLPADRPEPGISRRQLLQSDGGLFLPQEITLSILELLQAEDQVKSLTAFQQCSKSCYELAYPVIWGDELVVSMRGLNMIRKTCDPDMAGMALSPTPGSIRLWTSLSRVRKMRIVEVAPFHAANPIAGIMPPRHKGVRPPIDFINWAPFQRLESVEIIGAVGDQIFEQGSLQERYRVRDLFDCTEVRQWAEIVMRGFYLIFSQPSAIHMSICKVSIELPVGQLTTNRVSRGGANSYQFSAIQTVFYRIISELTKRASTLRLSNLHGTEDRRVFALLDSCNEIIMTFRPPGENTACIMIGVDFLDNLVYTALQRIRAEIGTHTPAATLSKVVMHIPLEAGATPNLEKLSSMFERGYLAPSKRGSSPHSERCAIDMYQSMQRMAASNFHPELHSGGKDLVLRTCERLHLDLTGLDKECVTCPVAGLGENRHIAYGT